MAARSNKKNKNTKAGSDKLELSPAKRGTAGAVAGAVVGSVAGPLGMVVGGVVGALAGRATGPSGSARATNAAVPGKKSKTSGRKAVTGSARKAVAQKPKTSGRAKRISKSGGKKRARR